MSPVRKRLIELAREAAREYNKALERNALRDELESLKAAHREVEHLLAELDEQERQS